MRTKCTSRELTGAMEVKNSAAGGDLGHGKGVCLCKEPPNGRPLALSLRRSPFSPVPKRPWGPPVAPAGGAAARHIYLRSRDVVFYQPRAVGPWGRGRRGPCGEGEVPSIH